MKDGEFSKVEDFLCIVNFLWRQQNIPHCDLKPKGVITWYIIASNEINSTSANAITDLFEFFKFEKCERKHLCLDKLVVNGAQNLMDVIK